MSHLEVIHHTPSQSMEESKTSCSKMASLAPGSYVVPTFTKKVHKQINLVDLRVSDLSDLKKDDPFLYYSIPAVRKASIRGIPVDESSLDASTSSRCSSIPLRRSVSFDSCDSHGDMEIDEMSQEMIVEKQEPAIAFCQVTRRSRISFESPDLTVFDDLFSVYSDDEDNDYDDCICSFVEKYSSLSMED